MSYIAPTFRDFLQRFPEFQGMPDDGIVLAVVDEAMLEVDEGWGDADRRTAVLHLAAHMLALEGWPGRLTCGASAAALAVTGGVVREKVGDVEVQYSGVKAEGFDQTPYGCRYKALLRRNSAAVFIV